MPLLTLRLGTKNVALGELAALFSRLFGKVDTHKDYGVVRKGSKTKKSLSFAFVTFLEESSAQAALEHDFAAEPAVKGKAWIQKIVTGPYTGAGGAKGGSGGGRGRGGGGAARGGWGAGRGGRKAGAASKRAAAGQSPPRKPGKRPRLQEQQGEASGGGRGIVGRLGPKVRVRR